MTEREIIGEQELSFAEKVAKMPDDKWLLEFLSRTGILKNISEQLFADRSWLWNEKVVRESMDWESTLWSLINSLAFIIKVINWKRLWWKILMSENDKYWIDQIFTSEAHEIVYYLQAFFDKFFAHIRDMKCPDLDKLTKECDRARLLRKRTQSGDITSQDLMDAVKKLFEIASEWNIVSETELARLGTTASLTGALADLGEVMRKEFIDSGIDPSKIRLWIVPAANGDGLDY